jgi:hypothetical protein
MKHRHAAMTHTRGSTTSADTDLELLAASKVRKLDHTVFDQQVGSLRETARSTRDTNRCGVAETAATTRESP